MSSEHNANSPQDLIPVPSVALNQLQNELTSTSNDCSRCKLLGRHLKVSREWNNFLRLKLKQRDMLFHVAADYKRQKQRCLQLQMTLDQQTRECEEMRELLTNLLLEVNPLRERVQLAENTMTDEVQRREKVEFEACNLRFLVEQQTHKIKSLKKSDPTMVETLEKKISALKSTVTNLRQKNAANSRVKFQFQQEAADTQSKLQRSLKKVYWGLTLAQKYGSLLSEQGQLPGGESSPDWARMKTVLEDVEQVLDTQYLAFCRRVQVRPAKEDWLDDFSDNWQESEGNKIKKDRGAKYLEKLILDTNTEDISEKEQSSEIVIEENSRKGHSEISQNSENLPSCEKETISEHVPIAEKMKCPMKDFSEQKSSLLDTTKDDEKQSVITRHNSLKEADAQTLSPGLKRDERVSNIPASLLDTSVEDNVDDPVPYTEDGEKRNVMTKSIYLFDTSVEDIEDDTGPDAEESKEREVVRNKATSPLDTSEEDSEDDHSPNTEESKERKVMAKPISLLDTSVEDTEDDPSHSAKEDEERKVMAKTISLFDTSVEDSESDPTPTKKERKERKVDMNKKTISLLDTSVEDSEDDPMLPAGNGKHERVLTDSNTIVDLTENYDDISTPSSSDKVCKTTITVTEKNTSSPAESTSNNEGNHTSDAIVTINTKDLTRPRSTIESSKDLGDEGLPKLQGNGTYLTSQSSAFGFNADAMKLKPIAPLDANLDSSKKSCSVGSGDAVSSIVSCHLDEELRIIFEKMKPHTILEDIDSSSSHSYEEQRYRVEPSTDNPHVKQDLLSSFSDSDEEGQEETFETEGDFEDESFPTPRLLTSQMSEGFSISSSRRGSTLHDDLDLSIDQEEKEEEKEIQQSFLSDTEMEKEGPLSSTMENPDLMIEEEGDDCGRNQKLIQPHFQQESDKENENNDPILDTIKTHTKEVLIDGKEVVGAVENSADSDERGTVNVEATERCSEEEEEDASNEETESQSMEVVSSKIETKERSPEIQRLSVDEELGDREERSAGNDEAAISIVGKDITSATTEERSTDSYRGSSVEARDNIMITSDVEDRAEVLKEKSVKTIVEEKTLNNVGNISLDDGERVSEADEQETMEHRTIENVHEIITKTIEDNRAASSTEVEGDSNNITVRQEYMESMKPNSSQSTADPTTQAVWDQSNFIRTERGGETADKQSNGNGIKSVVKERITEPDTTNISCDVDEGDFIRDVKKVSCKTLKENLPTLQRTLEAVEEAEINSVSAGNAEDVCEENTRAGESCSMSERKGSGQSPKGMMRKISELKDQNGDSEEGGKSDHETSPQKRRLRRQIKVEQDIVEETEPTKGGMKLRSCVQRKLTEKGKLLKEIKVKREARRKNKTTEIGENNMLSDEKNNSEKKDIKRRRVEKMEENDMEKNQEIIEQKGATKGNEIGRSVEEIQHKVEKINQEKEKNLELQELIETEGEHISIECEDQFCDVELEKESHHEEKSMGQEKEEDGRRRNMKKMKEWEEGETVDHQEEKEKHLEHVEPESVIMKEKEDEGKETEVKIKKAVVILQQMQRKKECKSEMNQNEGNIKTQEEGHSTKNICKEANIRESEGCGVLKGGDSVDTKDRKVIFSWNFSKRIKRSKVFKFKRLGKLVRDFPDRIGLLGHSVFIMESLIVPSVNQERNMTFTITESPAAKRQGINENQDMCCKARGARNIESVIRMDKLQVRKVFERTMDETVGRQIKEDYEKLEKPLKIGNRKKGESNTFPVKESEDRELVCLQWTDNAKKLTFGSTGAKISNTRQQKTKSSIVNLFGSDNSSGSERENKETTTNKREKMKENEHNQLQNFTLNRSKYRRQPSKKMTKPKEPMIMSKTKVVAYSSSTNSSTSEATSESDEENITDKKTAEQSSHSSHLDTSSESDFFQRCFTKRYRPSLIVSSDDSSSDNDDHQDGNSHFAVAQIKRMIKKQKMSDRICSSKSNHSSPLQKRHVVDHAVLRPINDVATTKTKMQRKLSFQRCSESEASLRKIKKQSNSWGAGQRKSRPSSLPQMQQYKEESTPPSDHKPNGREELQLSSPDTSQSVERLGYNLPIRKARSRTARTLSKNKPEENSTSSSLISNKRTQDVVLVETPTQSFKRLKIESNITKFIPAFNESNMDSGNTIDTTPEVDKMDGLAKDTQIQSNKKTGSCMELNSKKGDEPKSVIGTQTLTNSDDQDEICTTMKTESDTEGELVIEEKVTSRSPPRKSVDVNPRTLVTSVKPKKEIIEQVSRLGPLVFIDRPRLKTKPALPKVESQTPQAPVPAGPDYVDKLFSKLNERTAADSEPHLSNQVNSSETAQKTFVKHPKANTTSQSQEANREGNSLSAHTVRKVDYQGDYPVPLPNIYGTLGPSQGTTTSAFSVYSSTSTFVQSDPSSCHPLQSTFNHDLSSISEQAKYNLPLSKRDSCHSAMVSTHKSYDHSTVIHPHSTPLQSSQGVGQPQYKNHHPHEANIKSFPHPTPIRHHNSYTNSRLASNQLHHASVKPHPTSCQAHSVSGHPHPISTSGHPHPESTQPGLNHSSPVWLPEIITERSPSGSKVKQQHQNTMTIEEMKETLEDVLAERILSVVWVSGLKDICASLTNASLPSFLKLVIECILRSDPPNNQGKHHINLPARLYKLLQVVCVVEQRCTTQHPHSLLRALLRAIQTIVAQPESSIKAHSLASLTAWYVASLGIDIQQKCERCDRARAFLVDLLFHHPGKVHLAILAAAYANKSVFLQQVPKREWSGLELVLMWLTYYGKWDGQKSVRSDLILWMTQVLKCKQPPQCPAILGKSLVNLLQPEKNHDQKWGAIVGLVILTRWHGEKWAGKHLLPVLSVVTAKRKLVNVQENKMESEDSALQEDMKNQVSHLFDKLGCGLPCSPKKTQRNIIKKMEQAVITLLGFEQ